MSFQVFSMYFAATERWRLVDNTLITFKFELKENLTHKDFEGKSSIIKISQVTYFQKQFMNCLFLNAVHFPPDS